MAHYRSLLAITLLAASLHIWAISRTLLPAQDGLKFIRVARQFQTDPWEDVVRGSDVHPLYPALIAITEPFVARFAGPGPDSDGDQMSPPIRRGTAHWAPVRGTVVTSTATAGGKPVTGPNQTTQQRSVRSSG